MEKAPEYAYVIYDNSLFMVFIKMVLTGIFAPLLTLLMGLGVEFNFN